MIKTKEEIIDLVKQHFNEDESEEAISFIEDITDTINNYEEKTKDPENWKERYEQNDAEWRKRYKDRFFNTGSKDEPDDIIDEPEERKKPMRFEDLFTVKE